MRAKRGFTLIELLIVVVIIGIISGVSLLAFGDFGAHRKMRVAAEEFVQYIKLIEQRAILENATLGIKIDAESYTTYRFEMGLKWRALSNNHVFRRHYFPKHSWISFHSSVKNLHHSPDIIINGSGEMNSFELDFGLSANDIVAVLTSLPNGDIVLSSPKK